MKPTFAFHLPLALALAAIWPSAAAYSQSVAEPPAEARPEPAPQSLRLPFLHQAIADQEFQVELLEMVRQRLDRRYEELAEAREQSNAVQDALNVSSASFDEVLRLLQTQRVILTIDLAGVEARFEALRSMALESAEESATGGHEIIERLASLVELERDRVQQAERLHETGASSQGDLNLARQCLINAEIRLAEARSGQATESSGPSAPELTALMLDRAEKAARLAKVNELSAEMLKARGPVESAAQLTEQLRDTTHELIEAKNRISDGQAQLEAYRKALRSQLMDDGDHDNQKQDAADDQ